MANKRTSGAEEFEPRSLQDGRVPRDRILHRQLRRLMIGLDLPDETLSATLGLSAKMAVNRIIEMGVSPALMSNALGYAIEFDRQSGLWDVTTRLRPEERQLPTSAYRALTHDLFVAARDDEISAHRYPNYDVYELFPQEGILRLEDHGSHAAYKWRADPMGPGILSIMAELMHSFGMRNGILHACIDGDVEEWEADLPLSPADLEDGAWRRADWLRLNGRKFDLYADLVPREEGGAYLGLIGARPPIWAREYGTRDDIDAAFLQLFAQHNILGLPSGVAVDFLESTAVHPFSANRSHDGS